MSLEQTTLENGLRVVTESRKSIESVSVGAWVDVGARFESDQHSGITHCLEHMVFKGTMRRSARDLAWEIEAVGGHMNAYTSRDHTTYYARVLKDDLPLAVDILGDLLTGCALDEGELTREKEVICQEIGQAMDTPDDIIFDYLQETAFSEQALGRSILGTPQSVRSLTSHSLRDFLQSYYHGGSMVISAVGNLDHHHLVGLVEDAFEKLPNKSMATPENAHFTGGRYVDARDLEQVHMALGFPGVPHNHEDYFATQVYSTLLGGGMSSRLFQEIREERGLAYAIYSFAVSHMDTGLFGIYAGTGPEMASEMLQVIREEMADAANSLRLEELAMAKTQLKAGLLMGLESTTARMEQLGRQMLIYGKPIPITQIRDDVEAVDLDQVKRVASNIINAEKQSLVAIGDDAVLSLA